ncbi:flavin reductase family protein [Neorhizobium galegae]|uniref:flavin reductase family protein n=1 Tax=Neorhizobium galegae TaxID=399 RepID=UPI001F1C8825|nr:flavin reductase family protein [Neorhizobium galegae]UIK08191.1 flavin reductase family protein [Neorhizobium galegae]
MTALDLTTDISAIDPASFRAAMRLPATSVTVLATGKDTERNGLTVSAVCSLSDSPPMILACVNLNSHALPAIRANGAFSANFLTEAQSHIAERFAGRDKVYGAARFSFGDWGSLTTGVPVLRDALTAFDCTLEQEYESPTHAILIGKVRGIIRNGAMRSLIYSDGAFGYANRFPGNSAS